VLVLLAAGACSHADQVPPSDSIKVADARQRWSETGPDDYTMVSEFDCECDPGGRVETRVEDSRVVALKRLDVSGHPEIDTELGLTIDRLFEMIAGAVAEGREVDVVFDPELGYPTTFTIVWAPEATDGTLEANVTLVSEG